MNQTNMTLPKILLCEDETILAIDLKAMLEQHGYEVVGLADNGADALAIAEHQPMDIALMDIELNGAMNGIEVANSLRNTYDIPSIFLTGRTDMETFLAAKTTNPYGFLTKPVDIAQLNRTIELALQQHAKEKILRAEAQANAAQIDILMQHFPVAYDEEGRNFFGSMVRIAGGTSHHLNNMLFAIQGNLEWLTACATVGGFEKRYIQAALDSCTAAANFVKQLAWASGQGKFELKISSILDLVNRSLVELKKELDFEVVVSGDDYLILVEERMVMEAIKALTRNASEASDRHQKIEINVFSVDSDQFKSKSEKPLEKCVAIEVKDSGKGFSPKMAESVVEPFVTTHDVGRFGLGLSVARGVCFAHGGWLTISSAENMGTTARMFLPVSNAEQQ